MEIKAIETRYKGYRFRSRLEARWAVFFDSMQFDWGYEVEGYSLPSGSYLPDFKLPGLFVEIKGPEPEDIDRQLCFELAVATKTPVLLLVGNIGVDGDGYNEPAMFTFSSTVYSGYMPQSGCLSDELYFAIRLPAFLAANGFADRLPPAWHLEWRHEEHQTRESYVRRLIELDREYYLAKYQKEHPKWRFGVSDNGFFASRRNHYLQGFPHPTDDIRHAITAARSARFEHGECG